MFAKARELEFEEAAALRDEIEKLKQIELATWHGLGGRCVSNWKCGSSLASPAGFGIVPVPGCRAGVAGA